MKTFEFLSGEMGELLWPSVVAGVAIALLGAILSVPVVLKRLAFIGQGVSHAAFGGAGLALVLGLTGATAAASFGYLAVVGGFCVFAALGVALAAQREKPEGRAAAPAGSEDTLIGVLLVASMALGALLTHWHRQNAGGARAPSAEQLLFGSILDVGWADAGFAWGVLLIAGAVLWHARRPMAFYLFDEPAAEAFGVRTRVLAATLLTLLGVATVVSMKLAGAVLATALLVLPGATALRLSERLPRVIALACAAALTGVLGGLVVSFEFDLPPGACVVLALVALYAGASIVRPALR